MYDFQLHYNAAGMDERHSIQGFFARWHILLSETINIWGRSVSRTFNSCRKLQSQVVLKNLQGIHF